jgi:hypothetical protein
MRRYRHFAALALVAALAASVTGCAAEYDRTDIRGVRQSALGGRLDRSRLEVPTGMIVTAHIVSYNDDNNIMTMSLRAKDPGIVDVSNVVSDHDFAFIGLKPGTTDVEVLADDKVVLIISAVVSPQPAPP